MPVLSIIACGMLEDELAYVLSEDRDLKQLIIVENVESFSLLKKFRSENCQPWMAPLDRVPFLLNGAQSSLLMKLITPLKRFPVFGQVHEKMEEKGKRNVTVVVNMMKLALHTDIDILRSEVYRNIEEMVGFSDGILIFYGTCGHSLGNLETDFKELDCSLYFLRDRIGEKVEDCISAALGGNDEYAETMLSNRGVGTIYLTPMWASKWDEIENEGFSSPDFDINTLKSPRYSRLARIHTDISRDPDFNKNVLKIARKFDMEVVDIKGSAQIARDSYLNARNGVCRS
ncbi:MAG: DUF1638 domain-containing protein [Methanosarcinaceae archaeon]|nr:DUF1638 domain-containing protein [Methanosarcinaceae archaeon]